MTPNFYLIFETSKSLFVRARSLKKIYRVENFCANVLNNRQKIIKLADKSEFGWATVQEYVCDDLADDETDASKIKKAEKRAAV